MAISREVFIEILKDSYSAYYNINEVNHEELPLCFRADYKNRDQLYFLFKTATVWENERNEYCYLFSSESFTPELISRCCDWAWEDGLPRVNPHPNHQCTNVKVIFVADRVDAATEKAVQKKNATKNYKMGLQGYSNLLTGIVNLETEKTVTNRPGHELGPYFKKLFAARK